jgi:hypothetical protein
MQLRHTNATQQRRARRTSVAGAREWMTPLLAPRASAVPKRTLLDSQGVVGSRKSLRLSMLGLCGTCSKQNDYIISSKRKTGAFQSHLAHHTA